MAESIFTVRAATIASCAATLVLAACSSDSVIPTAAPSATASRDVGGIPNGDNNGNHFGNLHNKVCPTADVGEARCHSWIVVDQSGQPLAASGPSGYNPPDLLSAYNLPAGGGAGQEVAIVDAFDDPNAEADLQVYRAKFGLPVCTTANGCFKKVNQNGGSSPPRADAGWAEEISLDLDMVSAICPNCKILLVEASSSSFANLSAAVDRAATLGANVISNSYGGGEYSGEVNDQSHYNHPGIAVTVSSGDNGFGVEFPASSQYVTAVGGTSLTRSGSGFTERAWNGAGSGCSAYVTKPSWQHDTGCVRRTVADVSAVADPNTGVSVYDTYGLNRHSAGWLVFGGTSVAAPLVGAVYALAGNASSVVAGSFSYSHTGSLFDVTTGSNGGCGGYLCTAGAGYDGPTGNGSPRTTGAF